MMKEEVVGILQSPIGEVVDGALRFYLSEVLNGSIGWNDLCEMVNDEIDEILTNGDIEDTDDMDGDEVKSTIWRVINNFDDGDMFLLLK